MVKPWTVDELKRIAPLCPDAVAWARHLGTTAQIYDILDTEHRLAMWTATIVHESNHLRDLEENLSYSAQRIVEIWPARFPGIAAARPFSRNPERLANRVYANRMGNGPEESGEGWRYRGRGLIQITGRAMYERCGEGLAQPLLQKPDILLKPDLAALSAGWYWTANGCHALADADDMRGVTRIVNGGLNGLEERLEYLARARRVLEARP